MAKLIIQIDTEQKSIEVIQEESTLKTVEDLFEATNLSGRLLISLADMVTKSTSDTEVMKRLSVLKESLDLVLTKICNRGDV